MSGNRVKLSAVDREYEKNGKNTKSESHSLYGMVLPEALSSLEGFDASFMGELPEGKGSRVELNDAIRTVRKVGFSPGRIWQTTLTVRELSVDSVG